MVLGLDVVWFADVECAFEEVVGFLLVVAGVALFEVVVRVDVAAAAFEIIWGEVCEGVLRLREVSFDSSVFHFFSCVGLS